MVEGGSGREHSASVWQAVLAWFALPGLVAYAVPVGWQCWRGLGLEFNVVGLLVVLAASAVLLHCARQFFSEGHGTLAPWRPPNRLVSSGLYRFSRNPMYLSVLATLLGWSVAYQSPPLLLYMYLVGIGFQLRIILSEEPWQDQRFGADWERYAALVPRWFAMTPEASVDAREGAIAARPRWRAHAAYAFVAGLAWHGLTWVLAATLTPHHEAWDLPGLAPLLLPFLAGVASGAACRAHLLAQGAGALLAPSLFLAITGGVSMLLIATLLYSLIPGAYFLAGAVIAHAALRLNANFRKADRETH